MPEEKAKTGTERQRKYRERLQGENRKSVSVSLSAKAHVLLGLLCNATGETYSEIIEKVIFAYVTRDVTGETSKTPPRDASPDPSAMKEHDD